MAHLFGFGKHSAPNPAHAMPAPTSFADDDAGCAYFSSDQHHRHLAAAICRYLSNGRSFVLVTGNPQPDGEWIADAINQSDREPYRASVVQCRPDMDLGSLVRAYSRELGLAPGAAGGASRRIVAQNSSAGLIAEPESAGIWTLMSYLTSERQSGVTRMLILKDADLLDPHCFDDLQRLAQLDEQHIMPMVLLSSATDRGAMAPFDVLQSPIVGRLFVDHLEQEEVGAFIQSQLETTGNGKEMDVLFPPRIVEAIAVAAGGNAAVINRLARKVLVAFPSRNGSQKPRATPAENVGNAEASEHLRGPTVMPDASVERNGVAIAEAVPVSTAIDDPTAITAEISSRDTGAGIEPAMQPELIAEAGLSDSPGLATSSPDQATAAGTEHAPGGSQNFATHDQVPGAALYPPGCESGPPSGDEQVAASEIPILRFAEEAEGGYSAPTPVGKLEPEKLAFESATALDDARWADVTSTTISAAVETVVAEAFRVETNEVERSGFAVEQPAASNGAPSAEVAEQTRSRPGIGLKFTVAAVTVLFATSITLYSVGLDRWQKLPTTLTKSSSQAITQPEARVALPPLGPTGAAKTIAEEPLPRVSAARTSSPAASGPTRVGVPAHASAAGLEPSHSSIGVAAPASHVIPQTQLQPPTPNSGAALPPGPPTARVVGTEPKSLAAQSAPIRSSVDDANQLMVQRGEQLLAAGDIISARQFFERVAPTGSAAAAYGLAKTYDPTFLREIGARGVTGQAATAVAWYRRAVVAGNNEAAVRLLRLQSTIPSESVPDKGVGR